MVWPREDQILLKLAELEGYIVQMLNYNAQPSSSTLLKNRLNQAECYVSQIPESSPHSVKWRENITNWWVIFASKGTEPIDFDAATKEEPRVTLTGGLITTPGPPGTTPAEYLEFEKKAITKEEIRRVLTKIFAEVTPIEPPIESAECLARLKALLGLVAKAESITFAYLRDFPFQTAILAMITPLLPEELCIKFVQFCDEELPPDQPEIRSSQPVTPHQPEPRTVLTMKAFLIKTISSLGEQLMEERRVDSLYSVSAEDEEPREGIRCSYCKEDGHDVVECQSILRKLRCDNCNKHGHIAKVCPMG